MLRVWSEHLPYGEARDSDVLDLLERGQIHPIFAVRPEADLEALAGLAGDVQERGLEFAIWPLLTREAGYWPSVRNAGRFVSHLRSLMSELGELGVRPEWVAFDLEPPLADDSFAGSVRRAVRTSIVGGPSLEAYRGAVETFREAIEWLGESGIESLGVTTPTAAADLAASAPVWQRALEIPWEPLPWKRAGVMAYGSLVSSYAEPWLRLEDVRAIHYECLLQLRRRFGARAHVSLGLTGTGVFGDEPVYEEPRELALDVSAARAAGVDDIAIFCLEGILESSRPGRWIDAIAEAPPTAPERTWRADSVLLGSSITTKVLGGLRRAV